MTAADIAKAQELATEWMRKFRPTFQTIKRCLLDWEDKKKWKVC